MNVGRYDCISARELSIESIDKKIQISNKCYILFNIPTLNVLHQFHMNEKSVNIEASADIVNLLILITVYRENFSTV